MTRECLVLEPEVRVQQMLLGSNNGCKGTQPDWKLQTAVRAFLPASPPPDLSLVMAARG